jgi:hypothetical protein
LEERRMVLQNQLLLEQLSTSTNIDETELYGTYSSSLRIPVQFLLSLTIV